MFQEVFEEYANNNDYVHRYQHHTGDNWWKIQGQVHRRIKNHGMGRTKLGKTRRTRCARNKSLVSKKQKQKMFQVVGNS